VSKLGRLPKAKEDQLLGGLPLYDITVFREWKMVADSIEYTVLFRNEFGDKDRVDVEIPVKTVEKFDSTVQEDYVSSVLSVELAKRYVQTRYEQWHFDDSIDETLDEFIGMSMEEYETLKETGEFPEGWTP
jgi:hypothetical protein